MLLAAKQEIQTYYFSHDPNDPGPNLTLNHTRTLTTSKSIISTALALEATPTKLITHGPHWVFRSIVDAACLLTSALHSSTPPPLDPSCPEDAAQHLFRQCQTAVLTCSVRDGDLPFRAASMMRGFYHCREEVPHCDPPAMAWPNRVGASVTFWCLSRYHRALSEAQKNSESARQALREIQIPKQQQESKDTPEQGPSVDQLDDPFQEVDWSLFMDDIGWGTGDPVFMGLP
jgi:transcriptional regulatory protein LEU3